MDEESEHIREVFANYGLALYLAQALEKGISILLSGQYAPTTPDKMTKWRYDDLMDMHSSFTFGQLITRLNKVMDFPSGFEEELKNAIEIRNELAHNYWWEHVVDFATFKGREKMLKELREFINRFERLDKIFDAVNVNWMEGMGFTIPTLDLEGLEKHIIDKRATKLLRRKLKKNELLKNIYMYPYTEGSGNQMEMPLFEFGDGTFWMLGDCGLTYAPPAIDKTHLNTLRGSEEALPAKFNPRPKNAKDWDYRLILDSGFYIQVWPSQRMGSFAFRWNLQKSK